MKLPDSANNFKIRQFLKKQTMKNFRTIITFCAFGIAFLTGCSNDDDKDTTKPEIDMTISEAFPTSCTNIQKGSTIYFKALFKDNQALGAYSIDIHNNFNHHNHDTETGSCNFDPEKTPINPWTEILTFSIPANTQEFVAEHSINIPDDIDSGDYHFMIQLTDAQGWATMKGINIKIID